MDIEKQELRLLPSYQSSLPAPMPRPWYPCMSHLNYIERDLYDIWLPIFNQVSCPLPDRAYNTSSLKNKKKNLQIQDPPNTFCPQTVHKNCIACIRSIWSLSGHAPRKKQAMLDVHLYNWECCVLQRSRKIGNVVYGHLKVSPCCSWRLQFCDRYCSIKYKHY